MRMLAAIDRSQSNLPLKPPGLPFSACNLCFASGNYWFSARLRFTCILKSETTAAVDNRRWIAQSQRRANAADSGEFGYSVVSNLDSADQNIFKET